MNRRISYWIGVCKGVGFFYVFSIVLRFIYLNTFIRGRFKDCNKIIIAGSFKISGYKNIEINSMSSGGGLRLDAIVQYFAFKFDPLIKIGKNVSLGNDVHIGCLTSITIGDNVLVGSRVSIIDHDHGVYSGGQGESHPNTTPVDRRLNGRPIKIGNNVHIGDGAIILKGVQVGDGAVVSAGAVLTRDVRDNSIVAGNPAKEIKVFDPASGVWIRSILEL